MMCAGRVSDLGMRLKSFQNSQVGVWGAISTSKVIVREKADVSSSVRYNTHTSTAILILIVLVPAILHPYHCTRYQVPGLLTTSSYRWHRFSQGQRSFCAVLGMVVSSTSTVSRRRIPIPQHVQRHVAPPHVADKYQVLVRAAVGCGSR